MIKQKIDRNGKLLYQIPKSLKTSSVNLYEYEITVLLELIKYGNVRGIELRDFTGELRRREFGTVSRGSVGVRLQKLRDAGLIKNYQSVDRTNPLYTTHFSSYTKITLDVLLEIGAINQAEYQLYIDRLLQLRKARRNIPKVHTIATTALGTRLYLELTKYLNPSTFTVCKGVHHSMFSVKAQQSDNEDESVYPDIIVELPDKQLLAFEVDGGRQVSEVLSEKVAKYKMLMNKEVFADYHLRIIFVPIEADFVESENGVAHEYTRISYIKNGLINLSLPTNIEVFAYKYTHLFEHIRTTLYLEDIPSSIRDTFIAETFIEKAKSPMAEKELYVNSIDWHTLLPESRFTGYEPHAAIEVGYYNKAKKTHYFIYHMHTGNLKSQVQLNEIYTSIKGIMKASDIDLRIMLVYEKRVHRENDNLRLPDKTAHIHVLATSIEEWNETELSGSEYLPFYELLTRVNNFTVLKENVYL